MTIRGRWRRRQRSRRPRRRWWFLLRLLPRPPTPFETYRERFGEAPPLDMFVFGADPGFCEAVERGIAGIDERELARRLGWTDAQYERMCEQRADPLIQC